MKKASYFISKHIIAPSNRLNLMTCIREKILSNLPKELINNIKYLSVKNSQLRITVKNSVYKQEFVNKTDLILSLCKMYASYGDNTCEMDFKTVKVYVDYHHTDPAPPQTSLQYAEKSRGEFKNLAQDERVYKCIENIRSIIRKRLWT